MSDTTFQSGTVITSGWLNDVNDYVYNNQNPQNVFESLVSASTIAPTLPYAVVSGVTTISTITVPSNLATYGGAITLIPTGAWSTDTTGNIALASTGIVGKALTLIYYPTTEKWYPSY